MRMRPRLGPYPASASPRPYLESEEKVSASL